jgi:hypothetical protein
MKSGPALTIRVVRVDDGIKVAVETGAVESKKFGIVLTPPKTTADHVLAALHTCTAPGDSELRDALHEAL